MYVNGVILGVVFAVVVLIGTEVFFWRPLGERGAEQHREERRNDSDGCLAFYLIMFIVLAVIWIATRLYF
jgi:hypothetical protein